MTQELLALVTLSGLSLVFWACVGGCRFIHERLARLLHARRRARLAAGPDGPDPPERITPDDVAVIISAHNEEKRLRACLIAVTRLIAARNVFVGSDGSTDGTFRIAGELGCNAVDIQPSMGKARVLKELIDRFALCERYKAVLILDGDSEIDEHYLERALPLFDDPAIAAVAGHAISGWHAHWLPRWSMFFIAYRVRLYKVTQLFLRYGQTWKHSNVSFIVPGFASMYRCSALQAIDIAAPGLIIEDFNMTFELHRKKLGRIAYTPSVRCISQDPHRLRDYVRQIRRWDLGFWQTIRRHGVWPSIFWLSLGAFTIEMVLQSIAFLTVPALAAFFVIGPGDPLPLWLPPFGEVEITLVDLAIGVLLADYGMTIFVAAAEKKPILLFYGIGFMLLRLVDAFMYLYTLPLAFIEESDGRWTSPERS